MYILGGCLLVESVHNSILRQHTPMESVQSLALFLLVLLFPFSLSVATTTTKSDPAATPWPLQFHSILYVNYSGALSLIDLWYDWPKGRNFNIIQSQLGELLYDLEWTNGTSFYYTLDAARKCTTYHFDVGILRPNWMDGGKFVGTEMVDGFLCNVWEKADFITYYEDVETKRPVHWVFYTGRSVHVMTFEVGAVLEDEKWQAPVYCFDKEKNSSTNVQLATISNAQHKRLGGNVLRVTCSPVVEVIKDDSLVTYSDQARSRSEVCL